VLIAFAYPDRIGRRRDGSRDRFLLRNGRGARVSTGALLGAEWMVAAQLGGSGRESTVWLGAPIQQSDLLIHFSDQIEAESDVTWDANAQAVRARRRDRLGAITWNEGPLARPDPSQVAAALLGGIRAGGLDALPWDNDALRMRHRLQFMHTLDPAWPDTSNGALLDTLEVWLLPHLSGKSSIAELRNIDFAAALASRLTPQQRSRLDTLAPSHFTVPTGSRIAIDYSDPVAPSLAVRLQEIFGMRDTPRIGGGEVLLTMHLLSPAMRPVQVTRDLASFWRSGYFEVRKGLRARYPRHSWPDDPLQAEPTRRTRRQSER
jgi:ATP-dependent helicase HrpB